MTTTISPLLPEPRAVGRRPGLFDPARFVPWLGGRWRRLLGIVALVAVIPVVVDWGVRSTMGFAPEAITDAAIDHQLAAQGRSRADLSKQETAQLALTASIMKWTWKYSALVATLNGLLETLAIGTTLYVVFALYRAPASWRNAMAITSYAGLGVVLARGLLSLALVALRPPTIDEYVTGQWVDTSATLFYPAAADALAAVLGGLDFLRLFGLAIVGWYWPSVSRTGSLPPRAALAFVSVLYGLVLGGTVAVRAVFHL